MNVNAVNLRTILQEDAREWTLHQRLSLLTKLCWQVAALHRSNVVHGNITPEKIWVQGAEPALDESSPEVKKIFGYSAPELLRGERQANTPKTDIFSLGVLCYELVSFQQPFQGKSDMEILLATLEGKPKPLTEWLPECPQALSALCLKMLSSNKENRPASVEEIAAQLDALLYQLASPSIIDAKDSGPRSALSIIKEAFQGDDVAETLAPPAPDALGETQAHTPGAEKAQSAEHTPRSGSGQGSGSNRAHIFPPKSSPSDTLAHGNVGTFPVLNQQAPSPSQRYKVVGELARGGLGKILRATDQHMGRPVAIKEMLRQLPGEFEVRFLREAKITARLEHPAIIPVHDLGRWADGSTYYTMKLVNGRSFEKIIAEARTIEQRIALLPHVIAASDAMAYSHSQRIIHRDLKPHNVLIGPFGETVVIDWGIAKDLNDTNDADSAESPYRESPEHGELTQEGAIVGTPAYMPLEQAQGKRVDERADVYSLGAILYHLLSGKSPYSGKRSVAILKDLLEGPPIPLLAREPNVPSELVTIVEKAMARDLDERYPTAKELAEELKKYQTGQLVGAHRYSAWDLVSRTVKKYQGIFAVGAIAAVVLLMSAIWYTINLSEKETRATRSAREANLAKEDLEEKNALLALNNQQERDRKEALYLELAEAKLEVDPAESISWLKKLDPNHAKTPWNVVRLIAADALERGIPTVLGADWSTPKFVNTSQINHTALSPDGTLLATGNEDGSLHLWDLEKKTRRLMGTEGNQHTKGIRKVAFSPDGKTIATASDDKTVRLWELSTGASTTLSGHTATVNEVVFSPDGALVATASEHTVRIWDTKSGAINLILTADDALITGLAFSIDGHTIGAVQGNGTVYLWDINTQKAKRVEHQTEGELWAGLSFSADGRWLAVYGNLLSKVYLLNLSDGREQTLGELPSGVSAFAFSPDGKVAAFVDRKTTQTLLWRQENNKWEATPFNTLSCGLIDVLSLAFSPDGKFLATAGMDRAVRLWGVLDGKEKRVFRGHHESIKQAFFLPGNQEIISVSDDKTIRQWRLPQPQTLTGHEALPFDVAFSPDGKAVASASFDGTARHWDLVTGQAKVLSGHTDGLFTVAFSPDGRSIATAGFDKTARLWELATGKSRVFEGYGSTIVAVAFSPDGKTVALAGEGSTAGADIKLWDLETNQSKSLAGHSSEIWGLSFSPDGKTLASVSLDRSARIWDMQTQKEILQLPLQGKGEHVSFSPDGKKIAVTRVDSNQIQVWDLADATVTLLSGHFSEVYQTAFSQDGSRLASASVDTTVRLWDLSSKKSRAIRVDGFGVYSVDFSPDGKQLVASTNGYRLYLLSDDLPVPATELLASLRAYTTPPAQQ